MRKRTFTFISSIVGGLETIAVGCVTYFSPENAVAINASILIAGTAIIDVCAQFLKEEQ